MSNHDDHKYKHLAIVAISDRETSKLQFSCVILNPVTANTAITRRGVLKIATWIMGEKMGLLGWIHMIAIERMHMQLVKDFMMLALCKHKRDS